MVIADGCWAWTGRLDDKGYARFEYGPHQLAHRVSWEIHNGPIPMGLCVLHTCDNPPCCNPAHLFLGTRHDNVRDMDQKGRRGGCGSTNKNSKLTEDVVREIRRSTETSAALARRFGVHNATVHRARFGNHWRHV